MTPKDPYHANTPVETPRADAATAVCARIGVDAHAVHKGFTEFSTTSPLITACTTTGSSPCPTR